MLLTWNPVVALFVFVPVVMSADPSYEPMDLRLYFSEVKNDLTKISWVHGCNSKAKLEAALTSDVMMIEADVISGHLKDNKDGPTIAIMGHPPDTTGDLSLEQFLHTVLKNETGKGIKLDFKDLNSFKASEDIVEQFVAKPEVIFPFFVNADILPGPGKVERKAVDPHYFLKTCATKFPTATISAGWTVDASNAENLQYNSTHIDTMTSLLAENKVIYPVTFAVHAGIAANSLDILTHLIHSSIDGTLLTLWSGPDECEDEDKLRKLIEAIGKDKILSDIPAKKIICNPPVVPKPEESSFGTKTYVLIGLIVLVVLIALVVIFLRLNK